MNEPRADVFNTAEGGASIGIQAGTVTGSTVFANSTVYQMAPDASPEEKYELGLSYLRAGAPDRAREHIGEAIALKQGRDSAKMRFHWVLAMLSKRSYRDLNPLERQQIREVVDVLPGYPDDEFRHALEALCELLECLRSRIDPCRALKKLDEVQPPLRREIDRHLDLVLTGGMKDSRWAQTYANARNDQKAADRQDRVWAYFQPDPKKPRARIPAAVATRHRDWFIAVGGTALLALAAVTLTRMALTLGRALPVLACSTALVAGYAGAVSGLRWHYQATRLRAKERQYAAPSRNRKAPEDGFTDQIDQAFAYYFAKYVPSDVEREEWLAETAGVRRALRDEIVEIYREERVKADAIRWLIRYLVGDARQRWAAGTLWDFRRQYRTARSTKVWFFTAVAVLAISVDTVATAVASAKPVALAYFALGLVSGRVAGLRWRLIITERRRYHDEQAEYDAAYLERLEAFEQWSQRLQSTRPSESEMEYWLYCDKTVLLGKALRHYQLPWRDVIAHAFLQVPAGHYKRARMAGGPWRYSKYDVRLFLLTLDGVREVSGELDFEGAFFGKEDRANYNFKQVSSVRVTETAGFRYTLRLTLTNGPTRNIQITDPTVVQQDADEEPEDPERLFKMNLETTGFAHTLHILEGIAAEGRSWIDRGRMQ